MTEILQMFTGNPLSTFIGKKVEAATRPELESDDWALNLEICDMINENDDDAKDAVRAIKKRLQQIEQDRDFTITNRTITVLETCVSNCSRRFHVLVMTRDFILDLVKLIGPKNNPPIDLQERVLRLIERWAEAFKNQPDLSGVVAVYNDLKAKGVTFPPRDPNSNVPIQTPLRTVAPQSVSPPLTRTTMPTGRLTAQQPQQPAGPIVLEGEGYNKISQDLSVVQSSVEMFNDIMRVLESTSDESDWKLAADLNTTCRQMKERIVDLIERVANEDLTIELLRLNDDLNNIFIKYDRLLKNSSKTSSQAATSGEPLRSSSGTGIVESIAGTASISQLSTTTTTTSTTAPTTTTTPSAATTNELSLIDFNADDSGGDRQDQPVDPFLVSSKSTINEPKKLAEDLSRLSLSTAKPSGLPEEISSVREQDFAEIENWLSSDSGRNLTSLGAELSSLEPTSIPNTEFDNFLANRAMAGSAAPKPQNQSQTNQKPEPSS